MRLRHSALPSVLCILLIGLLPLAASAQIQKDQILESLPAPEDLGEGWNWTNPDRPHSDLGFQFTAYYSFESETEANTSAVVDIRTHDGTDGASAACRKNRERYAKADQVVLVDLPSLGPEGFQWHYGPHEEYGARVTFCTQNLFVTIGPSPKGLEVAMVLYDAFSPPGESEAPD